MVLSVPILKHIRVYLLSHAAAVFSTVYGLIYSGKQVSSFYCCHAVLYQELLCGVIIGFKLCSCFVIQRIDEISMTCNIDIFPYCTVEL